MLVCVKKNRESFKDMKKFGMCFDWLYSKSKHFEDFARQHPLYLCLYVCTYVLILFYILNLSR